MKRKPIIWTVCICVLIAAFFFFSNRPKPTIVTVDGLRKADIEEVISASGSVESETLVKISSDVSGEITDIFVEIGDTVHKGQPLVRIRPDNYQSAAERARAGLSAQSATAKQAEVQIEQAELKVQKAQQDMSRTQVLVRREVASQSELQASQSAYDIAKQDLEAIKSAAQAATYNVRSAQASLKDAEQTLSKTSILAPLTGTVLNVISKKGERVVGTAQMAGTTIMNLSAVNDLQIRIQLNENDVNRIKIGQPVRVRVDAAEDTIFKGLVKNVSNINKEKTTTDAVTEYEAIISLPQSLNKGNLNLLKIGMSASVDIITNSKKQVLVAPVQAVLFKTDSSKPNADGSYPDYEYVYVIKNGKADKRMVKSGISNSASIEITRGLNLKDSIATGPYETLINKLKDKMMITTQSKNRQ